MLFQESRPVILSHGAHHTNLADKQLKRLSMPTGYQYHERNGSNTRGEKIAREAHSMGGNSESHMEENDPQLNGMEVVDFESAAMNTSIYDNNTR